MYSIIKHISITKKQKNWDIDMDDLQCCFLLVCKEHINQTTARSLYFVVFAHRFEVNLIQHNLFLRVTGASKASEVSFVLGLRHNCRFNQIICETATLMFKKLADFSVVGSRLWQFQRCEWAMNRILRQDDAQTVICLNGWWCKVWRNYSSFIWTCECRSLIWW